MAMAALHQLHGQQPSAAASASNAESVPNSPVKRTQGPGAFAPVATKRQRSFPPQSASPVNGQDGNDTHLSASVTHDDGDKHANSFAPASAMTANVLRMEHARRSSSPGVLKSSLKNASRTTTTSNGASVNGSAPASPFDASAAAAPSDFDKRSMYHDYVHNALLDKQRGRDASYNELVSQFNFSSRESSSPPPLGLLQVLLHALTGVSSKLDRKTHHALVHAILTLPWATMGGDVFARTWTRFICTLCSARNEWVGEVLARSVRALSFRSDWRSMAFAVPSPGGPSSNKPTRRIIYARIHSLLRSLLGLIPTLPTQLGPLIVRNFPHKGEGIREHVVYVQNIFSMCEYVPDVRPTVLECVIGRSLEIDVEIQIELDDLEEAEADFDEAAGDQDVEVDGMKERDLSPSAIGESLLDKPLEDDSDSEDESDGDDDDDDAGLAHLDSEGDDDDEAFNTAGKSQSDRERVKQVRALADKLDAIMSALFASMEDHDMRLSQASKGLTNGAQTPQIAPEHAITLRNEQFSDLIRIFELTLLPTFKSRHVQFLLFWFASLERNFSDMFVGMLLSKAIYSGSGRGQGEKDDDDDEDNTWQAVQEAPMVMRIAASSYVASLVARAKFIDANDARIVMLNLCAFLDAHLDAHPTLASYSPTSSQPTTPLGEGDVLVGPHALFYNVAQACFYVFCFRWRDLRSDQDDLDDGLGDEQTVQWCTGMQAIKRAVLSSLNPLAFCSTAVVRQFASVAQLTGFMYCWNVIERNSRSTSARRHQLQQQQQQRDGDGGTLTPTLGSRNNSVSSLHAAINAQGDVDRNGGLPTMPGAAGSPMHISSPGPATPSTPARPEMDSFFPFDPYRLRGSTKWIAPIYREWNDVAPEAMLDDDDDENSSDEQISDNSDDSADDDDDEQVTEKVRQGHGHVRPAPRSGLTIPNGLRHKPIKPSKLSRAHGSQSFASGGTSVSTNDSSSVAQSLEAMSISPRYV